MAKVTIVFEDCDDGTVDIRMDAQPAIDIREENDEDVTQAQWAALMAMKYLTENASDE